MKEGSGVTAGGTGVMWFGQSVGRSGGSEGHPCGVCGRGVGGGLVFCVECGWWVHGGCGGISGKLEWCWFTL